MKAFYRDINLVSPTTKPEVVDAEAIQQEMAVLFNTRPTERLFDPEYGIALDNSLFDLITDSSAEELFFEITSKVKKYLSTVTIDMAKSDVTPDPDNNAYYLQLYFSIVGAGTNEYQITKGFKRR